MTALLRAGSAIEAFTNAASTSLVFDLVNQQDGDLILVGAQCRASATVGRIAIAGFAEWPEVGADDGSNPGHQVRAFYKYWRTGDPTQYTVTFPTSSSAIVVTGGAFYSDVAGRQVFPVAKKVDIDTSLDTTLNVPGIDPGQDASLVVTFISVNEGTSPTRMPLTLHGSQTLVADTWSTSTGVGMGLTMAIEARPSTGATGARNATTAGANSRNAALEIALKDLLVRSRPQVRRATGGTFRR